MSRPVDLLIAYRVIKMLVTPFKDQPAYKYGIIDDKGKVLIKFKDVKGTAEKRSYTVLHRFVFNLKRILAKVGIRGALGSFAVSLALLIKEDKELSDKQKLIESAVIKYLKETLSFKVIMISKFFCIIYIHLYKSPTIIVVSLFDSFNPFMF